MIIINKNYIIKILEKNASRNFDDFERVQNNINTKI